MVEAACAELEESEKRLRHGFHLIVAARRAPREIGKAVFQRQCWISRVAPPVFPNQHVDVIRVEIEVWHPVIEHEAKSLDDHAASESAIDAAGQ